MSLATKYRPQDFNDVCGQTSIKRILQRQLETSTFKNCVIFSGPSGCGKTTLARIFANKINQGQGQPIEVDGASNNGVDNVRLLIDEAQERSLDSTYKVFIVDECHQITTAGWNAFLKTIEEPPKYTLFFFCTTDPQKIPATIVNRCQVFNLGKVKDEDIKNRLLQICNHEGLSGKLEALDFIVSSANGSMRQAITYLDKVKDLGEINLENAEACLGKYSLDVMFNLTNALVDNDKTTISTIIEDVYNSGSDLKVFVNKYLSFVLQLTKYTIFKSMRGVNLPISTEEKIKYTTGIENNTEWFNKLVDKTLELKNMIKNDSDIRTTIEVVLLGGI